MGTVYFGLVAWQAEGESSKHKQLYMDKLSKEAKAWLNSPINSLDRYKIPNNQWTNDTEALPDFTQFSHLGTASNAFLKHFFKCSTFFKNWQSLIACTELNYRTEFELHTFKTQVIANKVN